MIIVNMVLEVDKNFKDKTEIKKYLYDHHDLFNCELKQFNTTISKKYGDQCFSMTFIRPNMAVITQRYVEKTDYEKTIIMRNQLKDVLINNNIVRKFLISEPFEIFYGERDASWIL